MNPDDKLKRIMQQSGLFDSGESTNSDIGDYSASSEDEWTPKRTRAFKNNVHALNNEQTTEQIKETLPINSPQLPSFSGITPKRIKQNETDYGDGIGDYSDSFVDKWSPDDSRRKSSITILADVHLPAFSNSFQLPQINRVFENNATANLNNEQPSSPVDTLPQIDSPQLPSFSGITPKRIKQNETDYGDGIGDYSDSFVDKWSPDDSRRKSSITILADVHIPAFSNSFQLRQSDRAFENNVLANLNNEQLSSPVNTLPPINSTQLPPFPGITPKRKKLNETSGLFESESNSEQDDTENFILNPESGLFEPVETESVKSTSLTQIGKKRISRRDQWERTKKIKGNLKKHSLNNLPDCRCKCKGKLSKKQVETTFHKFINLESHTEQNIYLQGCLQEVNPKRFRPRSKGSETMPRARRVFEYVINLPKKSVKVCQKAFLAIHGIKRERLVFKVQHQEKDISDGRGRQSNPKIDVESVNKVHKFIESLPARQSHYSRASSKLRKFLDSHLSIAELHRKFSLEYPECIVLYEKFRCIFNQDFNISFGQPRKDICTTCEKFKADITSVEFAKDTNKARLLKSAHKLHLRKAEAFLKTLSKVEKEKPSNTLSLCFDFQKNLPLPVTNITDEYYLRQLWLHNFGVHNLCQNTAAMFLFTENYAHKGPNEVITVLEYYVTKEKTPSQHQLDLYCDNCYSQNKNRYIFTFLDQLCAKGVFKKITVSYPIPGHSMMPIDRDFALIERKRKKYDKIYTPEYYVQLIKNSKNTNKFEIVFLEKSLMKEGSPHDVLKVKDYKKLYDERIKTSLPGISKCRRVIFKRNGKPQFSASMQGEDFKPFSLYKVGYSRLINETPDDCYGAPLTIKAAKLQDVKRLLESVPESERYFYEDLFNGTRDPITAEFESEEEVE